MKVTPGKVICVDELMSQWEGKEFKYDPTGCPHMTKMPKKPVSVGMECKCSCDAESGIMLFLELQEGKKEMALKHYRAPPHSIQSHTAITMRCVEHWFHTHRIVVGDSAFASVQTCKHLLRYGMHFIGVVKHATRGFPKAIFNAWEATKPHKGETRVMMAKVDIDGEEHPLLALDWKSGKTCKRIISTCSNGGKSVRDFVVERTRVIRIDDTLGVEHYEKVIEQPNVAALMFSGFSAVDVHDHYRQGTLELERHYKTESWWHRLLCTILGITYTDSYFAYCHDYEGAPRGNKKMLSYREFLQSVAIDMIKNHFRHSPPATNTRTSDIHHARVEIEKKQVLNCNKQSNVFLIFSMFIRIMTCAESLWF